MADRNTPQKLVWRARIVLMWADVSSQAAIVADAVSLAKFLREADDKLADHMKG
ncbi:hypothetical protein C9413_15715 [Rhizobium sp. SEMIA 4085]|uniref:Uncharacterized protein n=2 Tax=Rhizobium TaxID=379 RepID=A0A0B4XAN8_9HYPH|nr:MULTISPECIES: hypothetical protein [Rhizobium]AJD43678.1 hypothetical protein RGR602_PB00139 [Rhizobium gallicum bv. gallicum R602sp]MBB4276507.1 hypothetical protein [Rhizobium mongolense]NNH30901.1 hypothetical protein [Rhizobium sp. SEMIA 4085]